MLFHGSEWHTFSPVPGINFFPALLISLKGSFFSYCEMRFYLRNVNVSCALILEGKSGDPEKTLNSSDYVWKKFNLSKLYRIVENTIFYFFPQAESFLFLVHMFQFSSVQFSRSVVSDSLRPHGLQHARPPCPSPTPGVHPNPCPLSRQCHPTISSSVVPFSSCPQSFPGSGSFPMSQLFTSGGQSIGVSASTSVPPMNTQG